MVKRFLIFLIFILFSVGNVYAWLDPEEMLPIQERTDDPSPQTGVGFFYGKTDFKPYYMASDGSIVDLSSGGGGGGSGSGVTTFSTQTGNAVAVYAGGATRIWFIGTGGINTTGSGNTVYIIPEGLHSAVSTFVRTQDLSVLSQVSTFISAGVSTFGLSVYGTSGTTLALKADNTGVSVYSLVFPDSRGNTENLGRMATTLQEMKTNTLLTPLRSALTCSGTTLTYTLYALDGYGRWNFGGVDLFAGVSQASVAFISGTTINPKVNYVYFELIAGVPTLKATETESGTTHIDVGTFLVGYVSAPLYTIYGYNRNRSEIDTFVNRTIERFEYSGTLFKENYFPTASGTTLQIGTGKHYNGIFEMSSGNTVTPTGGFYFLNQTGDFIYSTTLSGISIYADGSPAVAANIRQNIVWGVVPTTTTASGTTPTIVKLYAVLQSKPSSDYISDITAQEDTYDATNYFPPNNELRKIFVPIVRTIINGNTFRPFSSGVYYKDVRGRIASGGSAGVNVDTSILATKTELRDATSPSAFSGATDFAVDSQVTDFVRGLFRTYLAPSAFSGATDFAVDSEVSDFIRSIGAIRTTSGVSLNPTILGAGTISGASLWSGASPFIRSATSDYVRTSLAKAAFSGTTYFGMDSYSGASVISGVSLAQNQVSSSIGIALCEAGSGNSIYVVCPYSFVMSGVSLFVNVTTASGVSISLGPSIGVPPPSATTAYKLADISNAGTNYGNVSGTTRILAGYMLNFSLGSVPSGASTWTIQVFGRKE